VLRTALFKPESICIQEYTSTSDSSTSATYVLSRHLNIDATARIHGLALQSKTQAHCRAFSHPTYAVFANARAVPATILWGVHVRHAPFEVSAHMSKLLPSKSRHRCPGATRGLRASARCLWRLAESSTCSRPGRTAPVLIRWSSSRLRSQAWGVHGCTSSIRSQRRYAQCLQG
jgi:hypothetical protein